jgi:chromosome partitioning protein
MYESGTRLAAEVSSDVEEFFTAQKTPDSVWSEARCFTTTIRRNVRLAEAPSFGQSIFEYSPSSNGAEDYARLAVELVESDPAAAKSPVATAAAVVRAA